MSFLTEGKFIFERTRIGIIAALNGSIPILNILKINPFAPAYLRYGKSSTVKVGEANRGQRKNMKQVSPPKERGVFHRRYMILVSLLLAGGSGGAKNNGEEGNPMKCKKCGINDLPTPRQGHRLYCDACRAERRKKRSAEAYQRTKAASAGQPIPRKPRLCVDCGATLPEGSGPTTRYCDACKEKKKQAEIKLKQEIYKAKNEFVAKPVSEPPLWPPEAYVNPWPICTGRGGVTVC